MKKSKILVSSMLVIALCVSLIAGTTFALFTSESSVNIAVTSGKVNVQATIGGLVTSTSLSNYTGTGAFENGGLASVSGGVVTLSGISAGDKVEFPINVKNNSTIDTKYRLVYEVLDGYTLINAMNIAIANVEMADETAVFKTYKSEWLPLGDTLSVNVAIELPNVGNKYQGLSAQIAFAVEAVQANGAAGEAEHTYIDVTTVEADGDIMEAIANSDMVVLNDSVSLVSGQTTQISKQVDIDLNGNTLNLNKSRLDIAKNADVTICDGSITQSGGGFAIVRAESELTLNNVDVNVSSFNNAIVIANDVETDPALKTVVNINNSTIKTAGAYGISTDATVNKFNDVELNAVDSTIEAQQTPLFIVVPGTYNFNNCDIIGHDVVGVIVRGGDVTFDGCDIKASIRFDLIKTGWAAAGADTVYKFINDKNNTGFYRKDWGTGQDVAWAALVVGNRSTGYNYPVSCMLNNTSVSYEALLDGSNQHADVDLLTDIYVYAGAEGVTLNTSNLTCAHTTRHSGAGIDGGIVFGGAMPNGSIVYNGTTVTEYAGEFWKDAAN